MGQLGVEEWTAQELLNHIGKEAARHANEVVGIRIRNQVLESEVIALRSEVERLNGLLASQGGGPVAEHRQD